MESFLDLGRNDSGASNEAISATGGVPFVRYSRVDEAMKQKLQKGSTLRIGDAEEFILSSFIPLESNAQREMTFAGNKYNQEILNVARVYLDEPRIRKNP